MKSKHHIIEAAKEMTHILANNLELTKVPIEIGRTHVDKYRTIGVGIQGLVDYLAINNLTYENLDDITELSELIQYGCVLKSIELAKERGKYPMFEGSRWDTGEQIADYINDSVSDVADWVEAQRLCAKYGVNMSQHTSPAPNTTTATAMDAAAGITGAYNSFFYDDSQLGKLPITSMYLDENPLVYEMSQGMFDQVWFSKVVGAIQKFCDTGISAERILDRNVREVTAKMLSDIYKQAWKDGNKAVYYLRTIKKGEGNSKKEGICASCEN